jgi:hypothetical protein
MIERNAVTMRQLKACERVEAVRGTGYSLRRSSAATLSRAYRGRWASNPVCAAVLAVVASVLLCGSLAQSATAQGRVLARERITVAGGGDIDAANGWNLYVPPRTVKRDGYGSITALGRGRVAIAISVPWHGSVEVTGPLRKSTEVVAHDVGGVWVPEGSRLGQRTVWVTQLSPFSISGLLGKIQDALCLSILDGDVPGFLECLAEKGISWLNSELISWVFSKVSNSCASSLIADGISASGGKGISIAVLKGALNGASCSETASSPGGGGTSTGSSGPPIPVSSTPVNNGGLQGPTVNPQGPTTNPQPNPAPTPSPTPTPAPNPGPPPTSTEGFFIEDDIYGGTWARTNPDEGAWYPKDTRPPNGAYWYPNGLGVAVSCAESAAAYEVIVYGVHETWSWWAHVTDGKWVPTVVFSTVWSDGLPSGLSAC